VDKLLSLSLKILKINPNLQLIINKTINMMKISKCKWFLKISTGM